MKGLFSKPITYGGWVKMSLIGTLISMVIMVVEFVWLGIIELPFKKKTEKDDEEQQSLQAMETWPLSFSRKESK